MGSLNDFKAQMNKGLAKSSHFAVSLGLPPILSGNNIIISNMKKITLFCDQTQIPGVSFASNQVRVYGEFREVPYEKLYEPITLSFYVDVSMHVKLLFDTWISSIQDTKTRDFNWPESYLSNNIDILVEDTEDKQRYMVSLRNCFPKAISPIQLDYSAKDIMKLSVNLSYQFAEFTQIEQSTITREDYTQEKIVLDYDYSYRKIPESYFSDFSGFQNAMNNYDFTFDGVRDAFRTIEDVSEVTGYGGMFGP